MKVLVDARFYFYQNELFTPKQTFILFSSVFQKNRSARKIQTWYRRHHARRKRNEAVMKRMLAEKKEVSRDA